MSFASWGFYRYEYGNGLEKDVRKSPALNVIWIGAFLIYICGSVVEWVQYPDSCVRVDRDDFKLVSLSTITKTCECEYRYISMRTISWLVLFAEYAGFEYKPYKCGNNNYIEYTIMSTDSYIWIYGFLLNFWTLTFCTSNTTITTGTKHPGHKVDPHNPVNVAFNV